MTDSAIFAAVLAILPVVVRLAAFVFTMPVVAHRAVPVRARIALVFALTILIAPTAVDTSAVQQVTVEKGMPVVSQKQIVPLSLTLFNEALIGALMGLSFAIVLASVRLVGGILEGLCGFSVSTFGGQSSDEASGGALTQLFWWTTLAVFVAVGGLGQVIGGVLTSFQGLPVGEALFDRSFLDLMVKVLSQSFYFALAAALPAVAAMLVASLVLGMTQKSFPQLGGMQVGLSIKALFAMVVASALLLTTPWIINDGFQLAIAHLMDLLNTKA